MMNVIINEGLCDYQFINTWCSDFQELASHVAAYTPEWAAPLTWLEPDQIRTAARMYATNTPGCIQWGLSLIHI